jgi:hypothetical protein
MGPYFFLYRLSHHFLCVSLRKLQKFTYYLLHVCLSLCLFANNSSRNSECFFVKLCVWVLLKFVDYRFLFRLKSNDSCKRCTQRPTCLFYAGKWPWNLVGKFRATLAPDTAPTQQRWGIPMMTNLPSQAGSRYGASDEGPCGALSHPCILSFCGW